MCNLTLNCSVRLSYPVLLRQQQQMLQIKSQPHKTITKLHLHPALIYRELVKALEHTWQIPVTIPGAPFQGPLHTWELRSGRKLYSFYQSKKPLWIKALMSTDLSSSSPIQIWFLPQPSSVTGSWADLSKAASHLRVPVPSLVLLLIKDHTNPIQLPSSPLTSSPVLPNWPVLMSWGTWPIISKPLRKG